MCYYFLNLIRQVSNLRWFLYHLLLLPQFNTPNSTPELWKSNGKSEEHRTAMEEALKEAYVTAQRFIDSYNTK